MNVAVVPSSLFPWSRLTLFCINSSTTATWPEDEWRHVVFEAHVSMHHALYAEHMAFGFGVGKGKGEESFFFNRWLYFNYLTLPRRCHERRPLLLLCYRYTIVKLQPCRVVQVVIVIHMCMVVSKCNVKRRGREEKEQMLVQYDIFRVELRVKLLLSLLACLREVHGLRRSIAITFHVDVSAK